MSISDEQRRAEHEQRLRDAKRERLELVATLAQIGTSIAGGLAGGQTGATITSTGAASANALRTIGGSVIKDPPRTYDTPRIQPSAAGSGAPGTYPQTTLTSWITAPIIAVVILLAAGITKILKWW